MKNQKDKLLRKLKEKLSSNDLSNLKLFIPSEQRDTVVFRMKNDFFMLEDTWEHIQEIANKEKIKVARVNLYANVKELDNILSNIEWLWQSNIPRGFMTLVAGEPGIGKSIHVLDLAKCITDGLPFPNSTERCVAGNVIWIDTEMKQQMLNERTKSIGINRDKLFIPAIGGNLLTKFDASNPEHANYIVNMVEELQPDMLVVDSLGHSHSGGENRIEDVRPVMDFWTTIARDYNTAMIVVHHLNKGTPGESTEVSLGRVRGSTDIVATPVVIFAIERSSDAESVKIRQIKNNIGRQQPAISAKLLYHDDDKESIKSLQYSLYTPPPPKKNKKEMCSEWVIKELEKRKDGIKLTELCEIGEGMGYTRGTIYSSREILGDRIRFSGTGKMSIWHLSSDNNDHDAIAKIAKANGKHKEKNELQTN